MQNLDFLKQKKHPNKDVKLIFILQHLSQMELSGSQWIPKKKNMSWMIIMVVFVTTPKWVLESNLD